mgnify:CR=1 FL=1
MGRQPIDERNLYHKRVFTTGEVAKILHVSQMSVIKWFNEGKLDGYRVPYSKDRRITRGSLLKFVKENELPLQEFETLQRSVLIVDNDVSVRNAIEVIFEDREEFNIDQASSGYEAGLKLGRMEPDVIVLDIMLSDMDARNLVKKIRADKTFKHSKILGISAYFKDADVEGLKKLGFDDFLAKPFTANELEKKVEQLLDSQ